MNERLDLVRLTPQCVIDAGCGEGHDLAALAQRYEGAQVIGVDQSPAMLASARQYGSDQRSTLGRVLDTLPWMGGHKARQRSPHLCQADFGQLPFGRNCAQLIWSNLALHWHPRPDLVLREWRRVLSVGGVVMFSCFGPDTFKELRAAFAEIDTYPHTLPFVDMHDLGDMLVHAGFADPVMDMEVLTLTYPDVGRLIAEVRGLGGNPLSTRRRGLLSRRQWAAMTAALQAQASLAGEIPLTIELVFGHAFRVAPKQTADGETIIRFQPRNK